MSSDKYILSFFLTVKWWQMLLFFAILLFPPFFYPVFHSPHTKMPQEFLIVARIIRVVLTIIYFVWIGVIGNNLNIKQPIFKKMYLFLFNFFVFIVALIYVLMNLEDFMTHTYDDIIGILSPFVFAGIFYNAYFIAKSIRTIELKRSITFPDYSGDFFLLVFFPIGIWIIQNRINKMFS